MAIASRLPVNFKDELAKQATKHNKKVQSKATKPSPIPQLSPTDVDDFRTYLKSSKRILALFGAGLSAPSGITTFRGTTDTFRGYELPMLSTRQMFEDNPILMWWYISTRRSDGMKAKPNAAHYALAKLGDVKPDYLAVTQNIDNLSQRAGHKSEHLQPIHGSLHDFKCSSATCDYIDYGNTTDPLVPALSVPEGLDISDESVPLPKLTTTDLPTCPKCSSSSILRPDVRWFGEDLDQVHLDRIQDFITAGPLDLMLVIGTCAQVYPAASYVHKARSAGARVAFVDIAEWDSSDRAPLLPRDWYFRGDVVDVVPMLLRDVLA